MLISVDLNTIIPCNNEINYVEKCKDCKCENPTIKNCFHDCIKNKL
jgi:hypothetical protein